MFTLKGIEMEHELFQTRFLERYVGYDFDQNSTMVQIVSELVEKGFHTEAAWYLFGSKDVAAASYNSGHINAEAERMMYYQLYQGGYPELMIKIAANHRWAYEFVPRWSILVYNDPIEILQVVDPLAGELFRTFLEDE